MNIKRFLISFNVTFQLLSFCRAELPPLPEPLSLELTPVKYVANLGYGHPATLAPLLLAELAPIDRDHQPKPTQAARTAVSTASRPPVLLKPSPSAASSGYYTRQYVGTSCSGGSCRPQYRWQLFRRR